MKRISRIPFKRSDVTNKANRSSFAILTLHTMVDLFTRVPEELIEALSRYLQLSDFLCFSLTCRRNNALMNSHIGWLYQLEQLIPDLQDLENYSQLFALACREPRSWRILFYALGFQGRQLPLPAITAKSSVLKRSHFHTGWDFTADHPRDPLSHIRHTRYLPRLHLHGMNGLVVLPRTISHCIHPDGFSIKYVDSHAGKYRYTITRLRWIEEFVRRWVPSVGRPRKESTDDGVEEDEALAFSGWYSSSYQCNYDLEKENWWFIHTGNTKKEKGM